MDNPNCDGNGPHAGGGVRLLSLGANPYHGGLILCRSCHRSELRWRRLRNRELAEFAKFTLPEWDSLQVYEGGA